MRTLDSRISDQRVRTKGEGVSPDDTATRIAVSYKSGGARPASEMSPAVAVHALAEIQRGSIGMTTRKERQRAMVRHLGASAMLGQGSPKTWWYLMFLDLSDPDDPQFLGATHVEGHDPLSAVRRSWELELNPGHEVTVEDCEGRVPKPAYRDQLHDSVGFIQEQGEEVYAATPTEEEA